MQFDYLDVNNYDYTGKKKNVINKMLKIMSGQLRHDIPRKWLLSKIYMKNSRLSYRWRQLQITTIYRKMNI